MYSQIKNTLKNNINYAPKQAKCKVTNELEPNKRALPKLFWNLSFRVIILRGQIHQFNQ